METQPLDWEQIRADLKKPFKLEEIRFRLEGLPRKDGEKLYVRAVPFVAVFAVQARLDEVVGTENWAFRWTPVSLVKGRVVEVKGALSLYGRASKEEMGRDLKGREPGETAAADALRNCAVLYGVGRYLSEAEMWVEVASPDQNRWVISQTDIERLRAMLPRPEDGAFAGSKGTLITQASRAEAPGEVASADEAGAEASAVQGLTEPGKIEEVSGPGEGKEVAEGIHLEEVERAERAEVVEDTAHAEERAERAEEEAEIEVAEGELVADEEALEEGWFEEEELAEDEYESDELEESPAEAEFEEDALGKIAEEAEESAPQIGRVHPEKVQAIRRLCGELGEQEPVGLEAMAADRAEAELARLARAWEVKQRAASATKRPNFRPASVGPASNEIGEVSDDLWAEYEDLYALLHDGEKPDAQARPWLRPSTVSKMIEKWRGQLEQRTQPLPAEMARVAR
jgi:hypothetical protein